MFGEANRLSLSVGYATLQSCTSAISGCRFATNGAASGSIRPISASTRPTPREYEDGTVIIRNADGFDLALHPVGQVEPSPAFRHAGFRAAEPADVRALLDRMKAGGVTIVERNDEAAYVAFKCLDPDGHRIEVYWEPPRAR